MTGFNKIICFNENVTCEIWDGIMSLPTCIQNENRIDFKSIFPPFVHLGVLLKRFPFLYRTESLASNEPSSGNVIYQTAGSNLGFLRSPTLHCHFLRQLIFGSVLWWRWKRMIDITISLCWNMLRQGIDSDYKYKWKNIPPCWHNGR